MVPLGAITRIERIRPEVAGTMLIQEATENVEDGGLRDSGDGVDAAGALRRASRKIDFRIFAANADVHGDALRRFCHAIVVQKILGAVNSIGNRGDRGGHHPGRVVEEMAAVSDHFPAAVLRDERQQAALADAARGDLGGQIAFAFARSAHVGEKYRHDVARDAAPCHDFYGRDAQAFLKNFARKTHGAGMRASDIGVMRAVGDVKQRPG